MKQTKVMISFLDFMWAVPSLMPVLPCKLNIYSIIAIYSQSSLARNSNDVKRLTLNCLAFYVLGLPITCNALCSDVPLTSA